MSVLYTSFIVIIEFLQLIFQPIFSHLLPWFSRRIKLRVDFELKNKTDKYCKSFNIKGIKADVAFEIASEGELEQIYLILEDYLNNKKNVELIFSSESVEQKVMSLAGNFPNLRIFRLPILTHCYLNYYKGQNVKKWITAKKLILCRYDFFPSLMGWKNNHNKLLLVSATLKNKNLNNIFIKYYLMMQFNHFDLIITADSSEVDLFRSNLRFKGKIDSYDFRVNRIINRLNNAEKTLYCFDFFQQMKEYIAEFSIEKRVIIGSAWDEEFKCLDNAQLLSDILNGKCLFAIAPHQLNKDKISDFILLINDISKKNNLTVPIYEICPNLSFVELRALYEKMKNNSGIILITIPGILVELYSLIGHAFVGGGFSKSVHSLLEPFCAGANLFCGPKVHRSTEFDFINNLYTDNITVLYDTHLLYDNILTRQKSTIATRANILNLLKEYHLQYFFKIKFLKDKND